MCTGAQWWRPARAVEHMGHMQACCLLLAYLGRRSGQAGPSVSEGSVQAGRPPLPHQLTELGHLQVANKGYAEGQGVVRQGRSETPQCNMPVGRQPWLNLLIEEQECSHTLRVKSRCGCTCALVGKQALTAPTHSQAITHLKFEVQPWVCAQEGGAVARPQRLNSLWHAARGDELIDGLLGGRRERGRGGGRERE